MNTLEKKALVIAKQAAQEAGNFIQKHFAKTIMIKTKAHNDLVTNIDLKAEQMILKKIKAAFPDHAILSEEAGKENKKSQYLWIVDPLDGTTNFTVSMPFYNVSIALAKGDDIVLGVVYYPVLKKLYYAVKGHGAFCNKKPLKISTKRTLLTGVFAFCHGNKQKKHIRYATRLYSQFKLINQKIRQFGAAALELCYVAENNVQGFFMSYMNPYDVAAGAIIAKEAGAKVTDFQGKAFTLKAEHILAAPPKLHKELLQFIQQKSK